MQTLTLLKLKRELLQVINTTKSEVKLLKALDLLDQVNSKLYKAGN